MNLRLPCLVLVIAAVSACQVQTRLTQSFVVGAVEPGAVAPVAAANAETRALPAGTVVVSFSSVLPARARTLLATLADVGHVTVTLRPATGNPLTQTVAKAEIANGAVSATFSGVTPGSASYDVRVLDAGGGQIGQASGQVTVTAGAAATVDATIKLSPDLVPTPPPPAGGGGTSPTTGSVATNITIEPGTSAKPLTLAAARAVDPAGLTALVADPDGTYWGLVDRKDVIHFNLEGTVLARSHSTEEASVLALNPTGGVGTLYSNVGTISQVSAAGAVTSRQVSFQGAPLGPVEVAFSPNGDAWSTVDGQLLRTTASGTTSFPMEGVCFYGQLRSDATGALYSNEVPYLNLFGDFVGRRAIAKYKPDGAPDWFIPINEALDDPYGLTVGSDGSIWLLNKHKSDHTTYQVWKVSPQGAVIGTYDLPDGLGAPGSGSAYFTDKVMIGSAGEIYVYFPSGGYLAKLKPDGTYEDTFYVPDLGRGPNGQLTSQGGTRDYVVDGHGHLVLAAASPKFGSSTVGNLLVYDLP